MTRSLNTKSAVILLASVLTVASGTNLVAHEGHDHKVMGTVSVVHNDQIQVKTRDAKTITFVLRADTRILKEKTPIKAADIKVGDRAVVTATQEKDTLVAKEIRVGVSSQPSTTKP